MNNFINSEYEAKQEDRKERLQDRAIKARSDSDDQHKRSHSLVGHIPMGQPILVGHHSERSHRNTLDKSWKAMGKAVALSKHADKLDRRAEGVGSGGISSVDPEAITKLKAKLAGLEKAQTTMKAANKALKTGNDSALIALGLSQEVIEDIKKPDFQGKTGFASYSLTNNNANIRTTKKRIAELETIHTSEPINFKSDFFDMFIEDGQIRVNFHAGKPSDEVRELVKRTYSFKWSRYSGMWVRKVTANALASAERLCVALQAIEV